MIGVKTSGSFKNTLSFLTKLSEGDIYTRLDSLAREGVRALDAATPVDTGVTGDSWSYAIKRTAKETAIYWINDSENNGTSIVILLQYGHGTGTGGYVEGRDFINPAMRPIFDRIADEVWQQVKRA